MFRPVALEILEAFLSSNIPMISWAQNPPVMSLYIFEHGSLKIKKTISA